MLPLALDSSPLACLLNAYITRVEPDSVEMSFQPDGRFTQATGVIQGGAVVAMLDFAMACAALAAIEDNESVATASLNVSYLGAALPGAMVARARIQQRGRRMMFLTSELRDSQRDKIVATATAVFPRLVLTG